MGSSLSYVDLLGNAFFAQSDTEDLSLTITNPYKVILVSQYGTKGDNATDDTSAIQAAIADAQADGSAGLQPKIYLTKGIYRVGTNTIAGASALTLSGANVVFGGSGVLKLAPGSGADAVLLVSGVYNNVEGITIDGNTSGSPSGRGECLRITGSYNTAFRVTCQNSKAASTGVDFMILSGTANRWIGCVSRNAGYNAFDNRGEDTILRDCAAYNFGTHGFNQAGGATLHVTIDGFYSETVSTAATCLIIDPGSGSDNYVQNAVVRNVRAVHTGVSNTLSVLKFARVHNLLLDNVYATSSSATVTTVKFVEAIKNLIIRDSYFSYNINFDELAPATGAITDCADSGGFCNFTSTAHGLKPRDIVYIPNSSVSTYNGLHEVTATTTDTFVTNCRSSTTGAMTGDFYDCIGSITLERVQIAEPGTATNGWKVSGVRTPKFKMHGCNIYGCSTKGVSAKQTYPFTAVEKWDLENNYFEFNRSSGNCIVLADENSGDGGDYFTTSRKIRWVNNSYRNIGSSPIKLTKQLDSDILLSNVDGGRDYITSIDPTSASGAEYDAVSWQVGDRLWKNSPAAGTTPGWVCTTAGTIDGASVFQSMGALS